MLIDGATSMAPEVAEMTNHMLRTSLAAFSRAIGADPPSRAAAVGAPIRSAIPAEDTALLPVARLGDLEVRLALDDKDLRRAQRVRYKVFFEQGAAKPRAAAAILRRDLCPFDLVCDHLVVVDHNARDRHLGGTRPKIVGTYRLLRQEVAARHEGFYTTREFAIGPLLARHANLRFLELGRSCVLPRYRSKRTIELLWRGIWAYARHHRVDVLMGCASFVGVDPDALVLPVSALRHFASAAPEWQAPPHPGRGTAVNTIPAERLDRKQALAGLPPLIKGYLRAGARFGDGVVVDAAFGTTDVFAILPLSDLDARYLAHFGAH